MPNVVSQMTCAVFIPTTEIDADGSIPFLTYLSGLTCTDENVCQKSGVFEHLSKAKVNEKIFDC